MISYKSATIEDLVAYFKDIKGYFTGENKLCEFIKKEAGNQNMETIMSKVAAIGSPTLWQNGGQESMVLHIHSLKIDDRLKKGDLHLVEDIGNFERIHNPCGLYHFASKYCCYHWPDLFPIYCSSGHRIVNELGLNQCGDIINNYELYSGTMKDVRDQFKLTSLNYLELNKFLWLYEDQLLESVAVSAFS